MTDSNGQSVGGIFLGYLREVDKRLDHLLDLLFRRVAITDYGTFDLEGRIFVDLEAKIDCRKNRCPACMTQGQCGARVFRQKDLLNSNRLRRELLENS